MSISPHVSQRKFFVPSHRFPSKVPLDQLPRVLDDKAPTMTYRKTDHKHRSVNHWGQRKLFISEIEFLTKFRNFSSHVVYAGAAPGTHIQGLADMFPELQFHLYDPADFAPLNHPRVFIHQEFFTLDTILDLKGLGPVLFISDIRTGDPKVNGGEELEHDIANDMEMQRVWVLHLHPAAAMLKFRLPWKPGVTKYLDGEIHLPVWGPETTTETRLVVSAKYDEEYSEKEYGNIKYEGQLFHFNMITRVTEWDVPDRVLREVEGMDRCYDCASEVLVLSRYLGCSPDDPQVSRLANRITQVCSSTRTLKTKIKVHQRKAWFPGRVYDVKNKVIIPK